MVKSADSTLDSTSMNSTDVSSSSTSKQMQITKAFNRVQPLPHSSQRWKSITNSVCYFMTKGMHPFQTVNEPGFRQLLQSLEPRYESSDRKSLANNYMRKNTLDKISCIEDYLSPQIFGNHVRIVHMGQLQSITLILIMFFAVIYWRQRKLHKHTLV